MSSRTSLDHPAPGPAEGGYADGFGLVARRFAAQLASDADDREIGAALSVYHRGRPVVDLWGGMADVQSGRPWQRDTRIVLFSVTKGLAAMAFAMLDDRGKLAWDEPVADVWPGFAAAGKGAMTLRTLLNHRGGLAYLDAPLTLDDCSRPEAAGKVLAALEGQRPSWVPGQDQGYHALTFGLYAQEIFRRLAGETIGSFLQRELFDPLAADVRLGTPADLDDRFATLYPPPIPSRVSRMVGKLAVDPLSPEARILRAGLGGDATGRRAFSNPSPGRAGILAYNALPVRRAELAWASATGSADGLARAYLPFAGLGEHEGRRYLRAATIEPVMRRQGWSERDRVLQKPVGWSQGFLKEERYLFCPHSESFGHAGMGGALGWCDPVSGISFGYAMNRMDWRVRSPRVLALCRALYECEPLLASKL
ncbi:MAG: beta-lactamase family protein [Myxococcales bacterium]|nr:beta-lactamase family protein [Myxococcales bacterium]